MQLSIIAMLVKLLSNLAALSLQKKSVLRRKVIVKNSITKIDLDLPQ